ncbi:SDR family NAD(P)-dependent oxidoreductase [Zavarzinia sp.]|uniref:SDR family NAD(P)-dependent oxidoreductase n=1 Tax=Zavarzinia sp. TaxID=2027920 RepID=UPI003565C7EE
MAIQFKGASAIVTGGASGIGQAIVRALAARGARVVVADIDAAGAEAEAAALRARGCEAVAKTVDVTDAGAVERLVAGVEKRWGRLDFLFNNAGVIYVGELLDMGDDAWRRCVDINLWGVINGVCAAYPRMAKQGSGCIVNTGSIAGLGPSPGFTIYAATKHAVVGLSQSLRGEARKYGVQVNVLCPGFVDTPMVRNATFANIDGAAAAAAIRKRGAFAEPDRVAADLMKGIENDTPVIVTPATARLAMSILRYAPFTGELFAGRFMEAIRAFHTRQ